MVHLYYSHTDVLADCSHSSAVTNTGSREGLFLATSTDQKKMVRRAAATKMASTLTAELWHKS